MWKIPQNVISNKIFGGGIREIATKTQDPANMKSNLVEFDKKVNNNNTTTAVACAALDDSIQCLSNVAAMPPEHDNHISVRQSYAQENSLTFKPQQHVMEGLKDNNNNNSGSSLLQNYVAFDLEWIDNGDNDTGYNLTYICS